ARRSGRDRAAAARRAGASAAAPVHARAHQAVECARRRRGRFRLGDAGVQLRRAGAARQRARLPLPRVGVQAGGVRQLRRSVGRHAGGADGEAARHRAAHDAGARGGGGAAFRAALRRGGRLRGHRVDGQGGARDARRAAALGQRAGAVATAAGGNRAGDDDTAHRATLLGAGPRSRRRSRRRGCRARGSAPLAGRYHRRVSSLVPPTANPHDRLADFSTDRSVLVLSALAVGIGVVAAFVAYALLWLIAVITNLAYYQRFSSTFTSPAGNHLGAWALLVPAVGGLLIGLMARYGSEKIRGHGIPEALEAILIGGSRVEPKVAVLKPLSSALSIG